MPNLNEYVEFVDQLDWEGGVEGIIRHGFGTTGDQALDALLKRTEELLDQIDERMKEIELANKDELLVLQEGRDDGGC